MLYCDGLSGLGGGFSHPNVGETKNMHLNDVKY